jgi:diaminopimelate epimerase
VTETIRFAKWHGLGNHFVLFHVKRSFIASLTTEFITRLCDPHFGVGADGLMVIADDPLDGGIYDVLMFNPDGTPMGMCGNGIRCVYGYVNRYLKKLPSLTCRVEGRLISLSSSSDANGMQITVAMGTCRVGALESISVGDRVFEGYAVEIPNPHFIIPVDTLPTEQELCTLGPQLEHHTRFAHRSNIEFVKIHRPDYVEVMVWERGAGRTLACGTGACATAAALSQFQNLLPKSTIKLPGGELFIEVTPQEIYMTGPAVEIFTGDYIWQ